MAWRCVLVVPASGGRRLSPGPPALRARLKQIDHDALEVLALANRSRVQLLGLDEGGANASAPLRTTRVGPKILRATIGRRRLMRSRPPAARGARRRSPVPPLLGLGHRRRHVRHGLRAGTCSYRFSWRWGWHRNDRRPRHLAHRQLRAKGVSLDDRCRLRSAHLYPVVHNGHVGKQVEDGEEPAAINQCPITVLATPLHAGPAHGRDRRVRGGKGMVRGVEGPCDMDLHSSLPCGRSWIPWLGRKKLKNLEKAGAAGLPSIPFPSTMLGIVPARRTNGENLPHARRNRQTVLFSPPRLGVERIDRLPAFPRWHGDQRDEGQERRHEQRNKHPCEPGTALRKGDKG